MKFMSDRLHCIVARVALFCPLSVSDWSTVLLSDPPLPRGHTTVKSHEGGSAEVLMRPKQVSELMGGAISVATLSQWRVRGFAMPHLRVGGRVLYRRSDVLAFLSQQERRSTSDPGPKRDSATRVPARGGA